MLGYDVHDPRIGPIGFDCRPVFDHPLELFTRWAG